MLSVLLTIILVTCVLMGVEISMEFGVLLHEASAFLVILNGMWVAGTGIKRISTVGTIFVDVYNEAIISIKILLGKGVEGQSTP